MTFQAFVDKVALYWTSLIVRLLRAIQLLIKKKKKKAIQPGCLKSLAF